MFDKELFGVLSAMLTFISYAPYFRSLVKGQTKPHLFTWVIWALATGVVTAAQYKSGAGAGAWATGFTCLLCTIIAIVAIKNSEKNITLSDWGAFLGALAAIPVWYVTKDPLSAVILVTVIDGIAYFPTFRKSITKPYEEEILFYGLSNLKHVFTLLAIERYLLTNVLYPVTLICMNSLLVGLLVYRRVALRRKRP